MCLPCFDNLRRSPRSDSPRHTQSHNMGIDLVILVISRWIGKVGKGNSAILCTHGRLAQRLAQVLYTHKAGGSNPSSPTKECEREGPCASSRFCLACVDSSPVRGAGLRKRCDDRADVISS